MKNLEMRKRLVYLALFLFTLFTFLFLQFYKVQILEGEKWARKAENQHYFTVDEPFMRGRFFTNSYVNPSHPDKPQLLVMDIREFHLYIDPFSLPTELRNEIREKLFSFTGESESGREKFYNQFTKTASRSRKLSMWLHQDTVDLIQKWWLPYARKNKIPRNAVYFISDTHRYYPFEKLLGQALHTIQEMKDSETGQGVPTGGLEQQYNSILKGKKGKRRLMRSPRNALETDQVIEQPEDGADVYLTINHYLQAIAEEEIDRAVKTAGAKAGWAIMMDPYTGEILALAQAPFFNPSNYQSYFNDHDLIDQTKVRGITDAYEPGSIMKPITACIALKANMELAARGQPPIFRPEDKFDVASGYFPGRHTPIKDVSASKYLNLDMGMKKSSNIYMARLAEKFVKRMGNDWYRNELATTFGFGSFTNIELPGETPGILPKPGRLHKNGKLEWSVPTPFSLAMGYNIQVNTIQMMRAWSPLANGGYLVQPTLIKKIVKPLQKGGEEILLENHRNVQNGDFPKVLDDSIVMRVRQSMKYVTKEGGTARRGAIPGYSEMGKTGSTRKIVNGVYTTEKHFTSMMGIAPANNPRFILAIIIDEPQIKLINGAHNQHGGVSAAPVFAKIAERSLKYLGVTPDDPFGYQNKGKDFNPEKADWEKENRALQKLYQEWNG
jgi:cell division protein FtsI (penicillin-binding protein 3)